MASTTTLKLPPELKDRLARLAAKADKTTHAYMVDALAERAARDEEEIAYMSRIRSRDEAMTRTGIAYAMEDVHRYFLDKVAGARPARPRPARTGAKRTAK